MGFRKTQTTVKRRLASLNIASQIVVGGNTQALSQRYDVSTGEYSPNYELTGLVLDVQVEGYVNDGSLSAPLTAKDMTSVQWYVNGRRVTQVNEGTAWSVEGDDDWRGLLSVVNSGNTDEKGSITIMRNTLVGTPVELRFEGQLYDKRVGRYFTVAPAAIMLTCSNKGEDQYTLVMGDMDIYSPLTDKQTEKEWAASHGKVSQYAGQTLTDAEKYVRTYPISLIKGHKTVEDYSVKLKKNGKDTLDMAEATLTKDALTVDLRLTDSCTYTVEAYVEGETQPVASNNFTIMRREANVTAVPARREAVASGVQEINQMATVHIAGSYVNNPEAYCRLVWQTEVGGTVKTWTEGRDFKVRSDAANMVDTMNINLLCSPHNEPKKILTIGGVPVAVGGKVMIVDPRTVIE